MIMQSVCLFVVLFGASANAFFFNLGGGGGGCCPPPPSPPPACPPQLPAAPVYQSSGYALPLSSPSYAGSAPISAGYAAPISPVAPAYNTPVTLDVAPVAPIVPAQPIKSYPPQPLETVELVPDSTTTVATIVETVELVPDVPAAESHDTAVESSAKVADSYRDDQAVADAINNIGLGPDSDVRRQRQIEQFFAAPQQPQQVQQFQQPQQFQQFQQAPQPQQFQQVQQPQQVQQSQFQEFEQPHNILATAFQIQPQPSARQTYAAPFYTNEGFLIGQPVATADRYHRGHAVGGPKDQAASIFKGTQPNFNTFAKYFGFELPNGPRV